MSNEINAELVALLDELLENGDFYASAIESKNYDFDLEGWKEKVVAVLNEIRSKG